jgi:transposase-like protein
MGNPAGVRRDFDLLEKRRFRAIRLFEQGRNQSEIARRVKVVRQTVARWVQQFVPRGAGHCGKLGVPAASPARVGLILHCTHTVSELLTDVLRLVA